MLALEMDIDKLQLMLAEDNALAEGLMTRSTDMGRAKFQSVGQLVVVNCIAADMSLVYACLRRTYTSCQYNCSAHSHAVHAPLVQIYFA